MSDTRGPAYLPSGPDGEIVLYRGSLLVDVDESTKEYHGQIELRLGPRSCVDAHIAAPTVLDWDLMGKDAEVRLPDTADLSVPTGFEMPSRPSTASMWSDSRLPVNHIRAGEARDAVELEFHVSGLRTRFGFTELTRDRALKFQLLGWESSLTELPAPDSDWFSHVVVAAPPGPPSDDAIREYARALFVLLTLVENGEVGTYPVIGRGNDGRVVWVDWAAPRTRGRQGIRGLPNRLVDRAVPALAAGLEEIARDAALLAVVDRATGHLAASGGGEVLDLRIPMACTGLELLSWAVLQREGWLSRDAFGKLSNATAASVRLLLKWAGIPSEIPDGLSALTTRRAALGSSDWEGPDVLFNIRNSLVHPPRRLEDPEWPSEIELLEAWQLSTWYLELGLLRLLRYDGEYWSRLRLGRFEGDVEPVPWATPQASYEANSDSE